MSLRARQGGVGATIVIILLAVLAVVGVSFALIATSQQISSARSMQLSRAYYAALAGADDVVSRARVDSSNCGNLDGTTKTVDGIDVALSCSQASITEGAVTYDVFTVGANAVTGSRDSGTLVQRRVQVKATSL